MRVKGIRSVPGKEDVKMSGTFRNRCAVALWVGALFCGSISVQVRAETADEPLRREKARGVVTGIVVEKGSGERLAALRPDRRFALTSTFKAPLCARVWEEGWGARKGRVALGGTVDYAPDFSQRRPDDSVTLDEACRATLRTSDNRAANFVLRLTGGPEALMAWLRSRGDDVTRLDRFEPDLNRWHPDDPRDTTTPAAAAALWRTLDGTLRPEARERWLEALEANETAPHLLRAEPALKHWRIADRTGAGRGTRAYHARVESPSGEVYFVAIHLVVRAADAGLREKDAVLKERLAEVAVLLVRDEKKSFSREATK